MMDYRQSIPSEYGPGLRPPPAAFTGTARRSTPQHPLAAVGAMVMMTLALGLLSGVVAMIAIWIVGGEAAAGVKVGASVWMMTTLLAAGFWMSGRRQVVRDRDGSVVTDNGRVCYEREEARLMRIMFTVETIEGAPAGPMLPAPRTIQRLEWWTKTANGSRSLVGEFDDVTPPLIREWCQAALQGRSLAINNWKDRFALPDGTDGQRRYETFLDVLANQEHPKVTKKSGAWKPTLKGWEVIIGTLMEAAPPPALPAPDGENWDES